MSTYFYDDIYLFMASRQLFIDMGQLSRVEAGPGCKLWRSSLTEDSLWTETEAWRYGERERD